MITKQQLQTALKDINTVNKNCYGRYCFESNCDEIKETPTMLFLWNTVPDSIKVIKQLLEEKLNEL